MNQISSVCVFCGANAGNRPIYRQTAIALGQALAARKLQLVYGGGSVGLMGVLAQTALAHGCAVTGVIPKSLLGRELAGELIGEAVIVETMHERKAIMARHSDAFITMPGGLGTLDELLEMLTWGQLGIQAKPVGVLNIAGYFDPLLQMLDRAVAEGFIRPHHRQLLVSADAPLALIDKLTTQELPAALVQWMDIDET